MKKLILILAIVCFASTGLADPFLVCDDPPTEQQITSYEVFQGGVTIGITAPPLRFDLKGVTPGQHEFKVRAFNAWGPSDLSDPYVSPQIAERPLNVNIAP